jgi:hypothetical protein
VKFIHPRPEHEVAYQDIIALVARHANEVSAEELLAIAANAVGKMMALQDQTRFTPAMVTELVLENMQRGNKQAINEFLGTTQGNA